MKYFVFLFTFYCSYSWCQSYELKIVSKDSLENKIIEDHAFIKKHSNVKSLNEEWKSFQTDIEKNGFFELEVLNSTKANDSVFIFTIELGKKTDFIPIYIGDKNRLLNLTAIPKKDSVWIKPKQVGVFLKTITKELENNGFVLAKVHLTNFESEGKNLNAKLVIELNAKRILNKIHFVGYEAFPEGYKRQIERKYINAVFTDELVEKLDTDLRSLDFITLNRTSEVLFTENSTEIYVFASKNKRNRFDGLMGFANTEDSKIVFNGYLDFNLYNSFNTGERNTIYWKNNGEKQTNLNIKTDWPFVFKSNFGIDASLVLFKNDSLFQNSTTAAGIKYFINSNSFIRIGTENLSSSTISNPTLFPQNESTFYSLGVFYESKKQIELLQMKKYQVAIDISKGERITNENNVNQEKIKIESNYYFEINPTNFVFLKQQSHWLNSSQYLNSELFRFGGINTIRGFRENSLQGHFFTSLMTEYQFKASSNLILHSIFDIGYYEDKTNELKKNINGFGFGLKILRENSLFNLQIATSNNNPSISNSLLHISFLSFF